MESMADLCKAKAGGEERGGGTQTCARIQCDGKQQGDTRQRTMFTPCRFPPHFFFLPPPLKPSLSLSRCSVLQCEFLVGRNLFSTLLYAAATLCILSVLCSVANANRGWAAVASLLLLCTSQMGGGCLLRLSPGPVPARLQYCRRTNTIQYQVAPIFLYPPGM
jgi:hypothetical protein